MRTEWFAPHTAPETAIPQQNIPGIELVRPTEGLQIAYDPRIPPEHQKFRFEIKGLNAGQRAAWTLDGVPLEEGTEPSVLWPVERGEHVLSVSIDRAGKNQSMLPVNFVVK